MRVTIISDASQCPETGAAGYGYWLVSERGNSGGGGLFKTPLPDPTIAEMMGVVNALYLAVQHGIAAAGDEVLIQLDCTSVIRMLSSEACARPDLELVREKFHALRAQHQLTVEFRHVRGHTNSPAKRSTAQRRADQRARHEMKQGRKLARRQQRAAASPDQESP